MSKRARKQPREVELKLELDRQAVKRLRTHPVLNGRPCQTATHEQIYFDTPGHHLSSRGYSLRIRRSGTDWLQTLKRGSGSGLFDRDEWEVRVDGPGPEIAALSRTPLRKKLKALRDLQPMGGVEVKRSTWLIERASSEVELALDEGWITSGSRKCPLVELELELKVGSLELLFDLVEELQQDLPLRISPLDKAERTYRLARGEAVAVAKAEEIELTPQMSVAEALSVIVGSCTRHFRLNEPLILKKQNDRALHQARVSMRRLRAGLSLFGGVIRDSSFPAIREELRWFTSSLGDARDLDVFLKRHADSLTAGDRGKVSAARSTAYQHVTETIDSTRLRTLLLDLLRWTETSEWRQQRKARASVRKFAARRLDRFWKKVGQAGSILEIDEEQRHRLRIDIKKMRYGVEFFGSLFGRSKVRSFSRSLEAIQEGLGDMNDRVTAQRIADELSLEWTPSSASAAVDGQLAGTAKHLKRLERIGPFWASKD